MNQTYLLWAAGILSVVSIAAVLYLSARLSRLDRVRKEFFQGDVNRDLEQILVDQNRLITKLAGDLENLRMQTEDLFLLNKNNIQKIGFIRYNPFDDAGGNISFALSLLNAHNDGVVISSLHGRDGTRMYAKAVRAGQSESKLTEEEIKAIEDAK
jgi:HAMP domain-containing protein